MPHIAAANKPTVPLRYGKQPENEVSQSLVDSGENGTYIVLEQIVVDPQLGIPHV